MKDPARLLDQESASELANALRAAREQLGSPERSARVQASLADKLAAAGAGAAAAPVPGLALSKLLLVLATAVLGGVGLLLVARSQLAHRPAIAARTMTRASPAANVQPEPASAAVIDPQTPSVRVIEPAPARTPSGDVLHTQAKARARNLRGVGGASSDTKGEARLISEAQHALESEPRRALASLDEHARRFPHGLLSEERESLRIDAELALGRHKRARQLAAAFVARFPHSPQLPRFRQLSGVNDHNPRDTRLPTE